ncbi:MAG: PAS domain S-box protein [Bacteroidetes bacterium]|nr:PAS domain S-box protein [Bacteroidota bacterium]
MQRFRILTSRTSLLLAGLAVLAVTVTLFVYVEITQSRADLLRFVEAEAEVLIETINRAGTMTVEANAELERAIIDRLRVVATLVETSGDSPLREELARLAEIGGVDLIALFRNDGSSTAMHVSGHMRTGEVDDAQMNTLHEDLLLPIIRNEYIWLAQDATPTPWTTERMFLLAQERGDERGVILLGISSSTMLEKRIRLGIGRLLRDIGSTASIHYVVLQDDDGILTASAGVEEMRAIAADPFLIEAMTSDEARSRHIETADDMLFEIVRRLEVADGEIALMRIGLSLDLVRGIQQRSMHRMVIIAAGFFVIAGMLLVLLNTRRRFTGLQREHRKMRGYTALVLDNISDAVVATDATGVITVFNQAAARFFSIAADEARGLPCHEVCRDDVLRLERTRDQSLPVPWEETVQTDERGERHILAVSTSVIRDDEGAVESIVAIARDITDQRRIQEQSQRRDRLSAMGELAAGIAHEIRNPLNAISIITQRFQSEFTPQEDVDEYRQMTRTIRSEIQRVNGIITQFLAFARPQRLLPQPCDVRTMLDDSIAVVRAMAADSGIAISVFAEGELTVMADREKIQQVLLNLLRNAIEAMEGGGHIKLLACRRGAHVVIAVADNGPGIPEEVRRNIFDLYFTTKATGTGLGLGIVHHIVEEHGGEINITSNEHGGTTVELLLPDTRDIHDEEDTHD